MQLLSRKPWLIQLSVFLVYSILANVLCGIVGFFASDSFCSTKKGPTQSALLQQYDNMYLPSAVILAVQTKPSSIVCGLSCQRQQSCNAFHFKKKPSSKNNCVFMNIPPKKSEWVQSLVADASGTLFYFIEEKCYFEPKVWGTWSDYGACNVTCGFGTEQRTRTCSVAGQCHSGSSSETRPCIGAECFRLLRHSGGLCLAYNQSSNRFVLDDLCDQRFQMINDRIYKAETIECLKPITATGTSRIELTTSCDDPLCEFQLSSLTFYTIVNTNTDMCFHQHGGSPNPPSGTELILYTRYNQDRLTYIWD